MKVIEAGFMRTGTMSMRAALQTLGYPCYHMTAVPRERGHLDAWLEFVSGRAPMDWEALFRRFEAAVDMPACLYYQELMQEFPDAKVVLTVRDPDRWYASYLTLHDFVNRLRPLGAAIPKLGKMVRFTDVLREKTFGGALDCARCIRVFKEHNEAVRRSVPPDCLLVFRVTEGWGPLCEFLGHEIPEGLYFPHLNEGDRTLVSVVRRTFVGPWVLRGLVAATGVAFLAWWLLWRIGR
jgi:hypothetical protein